jgi:hypothetical protein
MAGRTSRYHVLPRDSMDSDREDSAAHEYLLPSPTLSTNLVKVSVSCSKSPSIYLSVVLRFISFALGLTSFIILVLGGGHEMIAVDVFLMMTVVFDTLKLLGSILSSQNFLRVKIQVRGVDLTTSGRGGSFKRPGLSSYVDLGLAVCLVIATPICWRARTSWWYGSDGLISAVVLSYIVL